MGHWVDRSAGQWPRATAWGGGSVRRLSALGALFAMVACTGVIEPLPSSATETGDAGGPVDQPEDVRPGPAGLRGLTPTQYRRSVRDLLGDDVPVRGVGQWTSAIAAARGGIAPATVLEYEEEAWHAASFVFSDPERRQALLDCDPGAESGDTCVRDFLRRWGRRAFRRALTDEEVARYVGVVTDVTALVGDPHQGLAYAVSGMLQSPHFLYRAELGEIDVELPERLKLTGYEMAMRLSYLIWNTTPDEMLLDAAEEGELDTAEGIRAVVVRMAEDPRAKEGLREFLADLFQVDHVLDAEKDDARYPSFTPELREALREQFLRVAANATFGKDYRELFTTRTLFINDELAALYGLEAGYGDELVEVTLPEGSPRAGILSLAAFAAQHSYPGKTSPTLRGLFVRKTLLCQEIPPPPPDVDTTLPDPQEGELLTTRELLGRHRDEPRCATCHEFIDPIGFALETFDAVGRFRETENGLPIDPSGLLDGVPFEDAAGLGEALAAHPGLGSCLMEQLHAYASGHTVFDGERPALNGITEELTASDYNLNAAIAAVSTSDIFRYASPPIEEDP